MTTYRIFKDGKLVQEFKDQETDIAPFGWLLKNQSQSVDYCLRYGGYMVEEIDQQTGSAHFWKASRPRRRKPAYTPKR